MENVSVLREERVEVIGEIGDLELGADRDSADEDAIVLQRQRGREHRGEEERDLERVGIEDVIFGAEKSVEGARGGGGVVRNLADHLEVDRTAGILAVVHFHKIPKQQLAIQYLAKLRRAKGETNR